MENIKKEIKRLSRMIEEAVNTGRGDLPIVEIWEQNRKELVEKLKIYEEATDINKILR